MKSILILGSVRAAWINQCPTVTCSEDAVATDDDDWCLKISLETNEPKGTTVSIRECIGENKPFCDWGLPGRGAKEVWPYSIEYLRNTQGTIKNFDGSTKILGKCLSYSEYYGRGELYPGWKCLIDLDCHSKKCSKGICIGRVEG